MRYVAQMAPGPLLSPTPHVFFNWPARNSSQQYVAVLNVMAAMLVQSMHVLY